MKRQWEKRVAVSNYLYQCLVLEYDTQQMHEGLITAELENDELEVVEYVINHFNDLINELSLHLEDSWVWERVNFLERAIMLTAMSENIVWKTPKYVAIDQALITADNYTIDDSYKYINAILDKVIKADE